jgi:multidrug resistance efflux pump
MRGDTMIDASLDQTVLDRLWRAFEFIATGIAAVIAWFWDRGRVRDQTRDATLRAAIAELRSDLEQELAHVRKDMDRGSQLGSRLASIVEGLPDRWRAEAKSEYMTLSAAAASYEERTRIWAKIDRLEDRINKLTDQVRGQGRP